MFTIIGSKVVQNWSRVLMPFPTTLLCNLLATALWAKSVNSLNGVNNRLKTLWATTGEDGWETVEDTNKKINVKGKNEKRKTHKKKHQPINVYESDKSHEQLRFIQLASLHTKQQWKPNRRIKQSQTIHSGKHQQKGGKLSSKYSKHRIILQHLLVTQERGKCFF